MYRLSLATVLISFIGICAGGTLQYTLLITDCPLSPDGSVVFDAICINGGLPGPAIRVAQYESVRIEVNNSLTERGISIHFHGITMRQDVACGDFVNTIFDGASGISQCLIPRGHTFVYEFVVLDSPGTYYYHAHNPLSHGVAGMFVVDRPGSPSAVETKEDVIFIQDWYHMPLESLQYQVEKLQFETGVPGVDGSVYSLSPYPYSQNGYECDYLPYYSTLLNGKGAFNRSVTHETAPYRVSVRRGDRVLLRVINAGPGSVYRLWIESHTFTVIAVDGSDVVPLEGVSEIVLGPGERFDILVDCTQPLPQRRFFIHVRTIANNQNRSTAAVLDYGDSAGQEGPLDPGKPRVIVNCIGTNATEACLPLTALKRSPSLPRFNVNTSNLEVLTLHFSFYLNFTSKVFMNRLDVQTGGESLNGSLGFYNYPKLPPAAYGMADSDYERFKALRISYNQSVRFIINNQDIMPHSVHLHGHKFFVRRVHPGPDCPLLPPSKHCEKLYSPYHTGDPLNEEDHSILKDTLTIPPNGHAVVDVLADNPGWWLIHCHMEMHLKEQMQAVLNVGEECRPNPFPIPQDYPQC